MTAGIAAPGTTRRSISAPTVAVCTSKDCRRRSGYDQLRDQLAACAETCTTIAPVGCVGICSGPVAVVLRPDREPVVVNKIRSGTARRDLAQLVRTGTLSARLRGKEVRPAKAATAVRRARRAIARRAG